MFRSILTGLLVLFFSNSGFAKTIDVNTMQMNQLWRSAMPPNNLALVEKYPYAHCFKQAAKQYGVELEILLAIARGESNFNASAKSKSNAYGVMQILWPATANHLGINSLTELLKPCTNIAAGARYFKQLLQKYDNNVHLSLAAYNYGPGRIKPHMDRAGMPDGAIWYSNYIYDHYLAVIRVQNKFTQYVPDKQIVLLKFNQPYRAKGFVSYLKQRYPEMKIEWFKSSLSIYHVVLRYETGKDLKKSKVLLKNQGFKL